MENHSYPSYPDSGDSSPRSREIDCENSVSWDEPPPTAAASRVKLMISYGGRIQPRSHDNQLSYVGGDTKILTIDRSIRFAALLSKLASLANLDDHLCFKYQLPGEDLDALISVTNDEDLDHMMLEYDRLHRSAAKPTARLRVFLFPLNPPPPSAALLDPKPDRQWFFDALNSVPVPPPLDTVAAASPPPVTAVKAASPSPDFLFGLDKGLVPPPAVKVKDPAPEQLPVLENVQVEVPPRPDLGKEDQRQIGGGETTPAEIQRQIQELKRLQIAENQQQQQAAIQRNSSEETLARVYPGEYYVPRVQEKAPPVPPPMTTQVPAAYWPEQRGVAAAGRYSSVASGDQPVYLISTAPGVYPGATAAGQGYYAAPVPRVVPTDVYRDAAVYAVPPQAAAKVVGQYAAEGARVPAPGVVESAAYQVAYDSVGRAVYYTSAVPTYQSVTSVAPPQEAKPSPAS
ncbi:fibrous sheath CABYR-binding protein-like [Cocos nucifera]|uniref:Fibrous sheath CABYR-binding protein-like n=1 Tax=Cocos nucifera TaxID=13894 RepID=A0A8K0IJG1_COCNU|nr:fibrous sheath CABYR-binding protein-like [Cocos nucifera]